MDLIVDSFSLLYYFYFIYLLSAFNNTAHRRLRKLFVMQIDYAFKLLHKDFETPQNLWIDR